MTSVLVLVSAPKEGIDAVQLEANGLYYSWQDPSAKQKEWRVTFVPASKLPR